MSDTTPSLAPDWAALYEANVDALVALAATLDEAQAAPRVPATPEWTVREVYAHLAGGAADQLAGRMDGAPSPAWSARHVGERADAPLAALVAELREHLPGIVEQQHGEPRPAAVWDVAVHHADLGEALGRPQVAAELWEPIVAVLAPMMLASQAGKVVDLPSYELFRGLFSRRSREQMAAWDLPLDQESLDNMCIFGPRDDDQPVPPRPGQGQA